MKVIERGGTATGAAVAPSAGKPGFPQAGGKVRVRAVAREDLDGLRRMLSRSSPDTIYQRFHAPYPCVPERITALMVGVERLDGEALVAVAGEDIVGHAMYARTRDKEAEVAVVVEDGWQSKGLGRLLLFEIASAACGRGVEVLCCSSLAENRRVFGLSASVFGEVESIIKDGLRRIRVSLRSLRENA